MHLMAQLPQIRSRMLCLRFSQALVTFVCKHLINLMWPISATSTNRVVNYCWNFDGLLLSFYSIIPHSVPTLNRKF